jgi:hypothetical protein
MINPSLTPISILTSACIAMSIGSPNLCCAHGLRTHAGHRLSSQPVPQVQINYELPDSAALAVGRFWTNLNRDDAVSIDSRLLSDHVIQKAAASGKYVHNFDADSGLTWITSNVKGVADYYAGQYSWTWPGHGVYIAYQHTRFKAGKAIWEEPHNGWLRVFRADHAWQVRDLSVSPVPLPIQGLICELSIWKPAHGRTLPLYVHNPDQIRRFVHDSSVRVELDSGSPSQALNWVSTDEVCLEFSEVFWLGRSDGFVSWYRLAKTAGYDVANELWLTELVRYRAGHWTTYDIGIFPRGE